MPLIKAENLSKTYYGDGVKTRALREVSFEIKEGEFVAIMGPSGSGKSTLLHILGFLDKHTKGKYVFNEKEFDDFSEEELAHLRNKKMGFVFQMFNLLRRTSVLDNVMLPLLYSDNKEEDWKKMAKDAIKLVGLEHRMDYDTSQLSGGEKQRVAIARALVNNPQVIFADEPTGNLDSKSGQNIMEILQDLHESGKHTILLITHETYTAEHAERIINFKDGKISSDKAVQCRHHAREHFEK
ncbi:MAG: ABC transporter ATP-binding protein [Patescibacteria group bacterium]|nr:ABC transporter ATP-binding protein [Patescibacteria group bacterium]